MLKKIISACFIAGILAGSPKTLNSLENIVNFYESEKIHYNLTFNFELGFIKKWVKTTAVLEMKKTKKNEYEASLTSKNKLDMKMESKGFIRNNRLHPKEYIMEKSVNNIIGKFERSIFTYKKERLSRIDYSVKITLGNEETRQFNKNMIKPYTGDFLSTLMNQIYNNARGKELKNSWIIKNGTISKMTLHKYTKNKKNYATIKITDSRNNILYPKGCYIKFGTDKYMDFLYAKQMSENVYNFKLTRQ